MLIFDFGGGTFDTTILHASDGILDVAQTKGDMRLGGRDLDEILVQMCFDTLQDDDEENPNRFKLRESAEG